MKHLLLMSGILLLSLVALSQQKHRDLSVADSSFTGDPYTSIRLQDEPKFYITLHSGYALALGSTFKFYPDDITDISMRMSAGGAASKQVTSKAAARGLGQGFRYGAGISYIINDFINVGLDFDYFSSTISKTRDSSAQQTQMTGNGMVANNFNERYIISYQTRLLTISPTITFKAISRPRFFIYNKVGLIMTFRPNSLQKETQHDQWTQVWQGFSKDSSSTSSSRYDWGIRNPALGFMGAIGAQVKLMEKLRAYAELQFSHVQFVVRNRVLTSQTVDGQEKVNSLTLSQREVDFRKTLTTDQLNADPDRPSLAITQRFPLTYVGLQLGLAYRF